LSGHILIAGYGRVGQAVGALLTARGQAYLALDVDADCVRASRAEGRSVFFGDASRAEVLEAAGADRAKAVVVALDDREATTRLVRALREAHPELPIYVRARDPEHAQNLQQDGATYAVPETIAGSLLLGAAILEGLGHDIAEVDRFMDSIRAKGYADLGHSPKGRP
jgi:CPA2 family monovalent cation:H+ antiporter-2